MGCNLSRGGVEGGQERVDRAQYRTFLGNLG